jgi:hypothetical protein
MFGRPAMMPPATPTTPLHPPTPSSGGGDQTAQPANQAIAKQTNKGLKLSVSDDCDPIG